MRKPVLWSMTALMGAAACLMTSLLGPLGAALLLLLATPVLLRPDRLVALSGLLTGFGGLWLLLLANQVRSGATIENGALWTMVGAAPLTLGLVAMAVAGARRSRGQPTRAL